MAVEEIIKARQIQKHDTEFNWYKAEGFRPKAGEIIVYDDLKKIKVGDGEKTVQELPFLTEGFCVEEQEYGTAEYNAERISKEANQGSLVYFKPYGCSEYILLSDYSQERAVFEHVEDEKIVAYVINIDGNVTRELPNYVSSQELSREVESKIFVYEDDKVFFNGDEVAAERIVEIIRDYGNAFLRVSESGSNQPIDIPWNSLKNDSVTFATFDEKGDYIVYTVGADGQVTKTVEDFLKDYRNKRIDATEAIQNAINNHNTVYIPEGTYEIHGTIRIGKFPKKDRNGELITDEDGETVWEDLSKHSLVLASGATLIRPTEGKDKDGNTITITNTDPIVWITGKYNSLIGAGMTNSHIKSEIETPYGVLLIGDKGIYIPESEEDPNPGMGVDHEAYMTAWNTVRDIGIGGHRSGGNGYFCSNDKYFKLNVDTGILTVQDGYTVKTAGFGDAKAIEYNLKDAGKGTYTFIMNDNAEVKCTNATSDNGDTKGLYMCSANGYGDTGCYYNIVQNIYITDVNNGLMLEGSANANTIGNLHFSAVGRHKNYGCAAIHLRTPLKNNFDRSRMVSENVISGAFLTLSDSATMLHIERKAILNHIQDLACEAGGEYSQGIRVSERLYGQTSGSPSVSEQNIISIESNSKKAHEMSEAFKNNNTIQTRSSFRSPTLNAQALNLESDEVVVRQKPIKVTNITENQNVALIAVDLYGAQGYLKNTHLTVDLDVWFAGDEAIKDVYGKGRYLVSVTRTQDGYSECPEVKLINVDSSQPIFLDPLILTAEGEVVNLKTEKDEDVLDTDANIYPEPDYKDSETKSYTIVFAVKCPDCGGSTTENSVYCNYQITGKKDYFTARGASTNEIEKLNNLAYVKSEQYLTDKDLSFLYPNETVKSGFVVKYESTHERDLLYIDTLSSRATKITRCATKNLFDWQGQIIKFEKDDGYAYFGYNEFSLPAGTYTISARRTPDEQKLNPLGEKQKSRSIYIDINGTKKGAVVNGTFAKDDEVKSSEPITVRNGDRIRVYNGNRNSAQDTTQTILRERFYLQIEVGNIATDYEQYQGYTYDIADKKSITTYAYNGPNYIYADIGKIVVSSKKYQNTSDMLTRIVDECAIISSASGSIIELHDSSNMNVHGLNFCGKPPQNGKVLKSTEADKAITTSIRGKNILGGVALAETFKNVIGEVNLNTPGVIGFSATNVSGKHLFTEFKPNTRYTFFFYGYKGGNPITMHSNMGIRYTNGDLTDIKFDKGATPSLYITVSDEGKTISRLGGMEKFGSTYLQYDKCGIFEGVLTKEDFEPYIEQIISVSTPGGLRSVGDVKDEIDFARGVYVKRIGVIDSYAGETIETNYISSTGGLDIDAVVQYVLPEPEEINLSKKELEAYATLHTYKPYTYIYTNGAADTTVKYVADAKTYIDNKFTVLRNAIVNLGGNV